jgi:hypothetical protein
MKIRRSVIWNSIAAAVFGLVFLMPSAGFAKKITSDRTLQDIKDAEAAQKEQAKKETTPADSKRRVNGSYTDLNGFIFKYTVTLPAMVAPGTKYPFFIGSAGARALGMPSSQALYPCYTMSCYAPDNIVLKFPDWKSVTASAYKVILDKLIAEYGNIDTNRIYVQGASKYGATSFISAYNYPDMYAAILPSVAACDLSKAKIIAERKIGIWMFQGLLDPAVKSTMPRLSSHIYNTLVNAGYDPMYTEYTYGDHHEYGFTDSLANPAWNDFTAVRKWLFEQKKPPAGWPIINGPATALGTVGEPFSYKITASNTPKSFGAVITLERAESSTGELSTPEKDLPDGLVFDPKTGIISGTPREAGRSFITLKATNDKGTGITTLELAVK